MKQVFVIASEEGALRYGGEVGEEREVELSADEKKAVVAAGWVEEVPEKKAKEAKT